MTLRGIAAKYIEIASGSPISRFRCGPVEIERRSDGGMILSEGAARQIAHALNEQSAGRGGGAGSFINLPCGHKTAGRLEGPTTLACPECWQAFTLPPVRPATPRGSRWRDRRGNEQARVSSGAHSGSGNRRRGKYHAGSVG